MSLRLGPLGNLRTITPLTGIDMSPERFGGVHTSLSGRRTVDHMGARRKFDMSWSHFPEKAEFRWLQALYYRHIPGPLRLLFGEMQPNRLSREAASMRQDSGDLGPRSEAGVLDPSTAWPDEVDPPGRSITWKRWDEGDTLHLDRGTPAPVLPGETVTGSLWVRSVAADRVYLSAEHYDGTDYPSHVDGDTVALTADEWQRVTVTTTPDEDASHNALGVRLSLAVDTLDADTPELTIAAAQLETSDEAGEWHQGGGAPLVAVDEMKIESLHAPLMKPSLTLVEL